MRIPRPLLLAAALLAAAAPAAAQQGDFASALPFRPGQWGSQFGFSGTLTSLGAMRFRSSRAAWVVDLAGFVNRDTYETEGDFTDREVTDLFVSGQFGTRTFHPVAARVNAYRGFGLYGSSSKATGLGFPGLGDVYVQRRSSAGVYGEVGATWMVTPNLGLGASGELIASYRWSGTEPPAGERVTSTGYGVNVGRGRLLVSLFL